MSRQTSVNYSDATPDVTRSYDNAGRIATMVDGAGTATYTFDNADRLTDIVRTGGGSGINGTLHYGYDAADNITGRTLPDGTAITIGFDDDNRPTTHTVSSQTTTVGYDEAGNITSIAQPSGNGLTESRTVDRAGRLTAVNNGLSSFTWTLDAAGNPTKIQSMQTGVVRKDVFDYDARNRLSDECASFTASTCAGLTKYLAYTYDKVVMLSGQSGSGEERV